MAEPTESLPAKPTKQSSPRYPFIGLRKALERAEQLRKVAGANPALVSDAKAAWGYAVKSSGGDQTVAALNYYGLIEDVGTGKVRKVKLTDAALRYFRDERLELRAELTASFALQPKAMQKIYALWKHDPPTDSVARSILKVDLHYSDWAANELLQVYKENLAFIPRQTSAKLPSGEQAAGEPGTTPTVKIGDYVQWTSNGVLQFRIPQRVTWISEDGSHLRVHGGSMTGIPMSEVAITEPPAAPPAGASSAWVQGKNELNVLQRGDHLEITATVDLEGLENLKEVLGHYENILKLIKTTQK